MSIALHSFRNYSGISVSDHCGDIGEVGRKTALLCLFSEHIYSQSYFWQWHLAVLSLVLLLKDLSDTFLRWKDTETQHNVTIPSSWPRLACTPGETSQRDVWRSEWVRECLCKSVCIFMCVGEVWKRPSAFDHGRYHLLMCDSNSWWKLLKKIEDVREGERWREQEISECEREIETKQSICQEKDTWSALTALTKLPIWTIYDEGRYWVEIWQDFIEEVWRQLN